MSDKDIKINWSELAFFGKITAGITHEIKNGLAVIKEETGLASDLLKLIQKGHPPDFDRIKDLLEKINRRIDKTDDVLKDLNRFSHSVDQVTTVFDLNEVIVLMARLVKRFLHTHSVDLEVIPAKEQIQIESNPFFLKQLLFIFIENAVKLSRKGEKIIIAVEKFNGSPSFIFSGNFSEPVKPDNSQNKSLDYLIEYLNCSISFSQNKEKTILSFPKINEMK